MSDVIDGETFEEFAEHLFADEYCAECGGDAPDHEPWVVMGHWFAHCKAHTIWPERTERGEYDRDHDRIVCEFCDWYDTGGPTGCAWTYHDHLAEAHAEAQLEEEPSEAG